MDEASLLGAGGLAIKPEIMSFQTLISTPEALNLEDSVRANYLKFPALLPKIRGLEKKEEQ